MMTTATPIAAGERLARLGAAAEVELRGNILPFWLRLRDTDRGGFFGVATSRGRPLPSAAKGAVLHARILWALSSAHARWPDGELAEGAEAAFRFIAERLWDAERGGVAWTCAPDGGAGDGAKHLYAQAFAIYGLAAFHAATGSAEPLALALRLFEIVEARAADPAGGYREAFTADWRPAPNILMDETAPAKTFNAHFHLLEAYAALHAVWPDDRLGERARALVELLLDRAFDSVGQTFRQLFDAEWRPQDVGLSFGHDIEASWLLPRAAAQIGSPETAAQLTGLATAVLLRAQQGDGALIASPASDERILWVQAEALAGFVDVVARTGDLTFLAAAERVWAFVQSALVDREFGEWRGRVDAEGHPPPGPQPKAHLWKCPYHNGRACLVLVDAATEARAAVA